MRREVEYTSRPPIEVSSEEPTTDIVDALGKFPARVG
jgi:hypothetical protein